MRILYEFQVNLGDGPIVGRETCDVSNGSRLLKTTALGDLVYKVEAEGRGFKWPWLTIIGEPKRIPVERWKALLGGCALMLEVNARVNAFVLVLPDGGYKWSLVGDDEETSERVTLASGTRDTLEAAQLAAEDAIEKMWTDFGRAIGR